MRPVRVRRASACSSGAGIECTVSPTASARAAASRADELEPDIKTRDEGAERKPLQRVAVVLGDIEHGRRPCRCSPSAGAAAPSSCTTASGRSASPVSRAKAARSRFCRITPDAALSNSYSLARPGAMRPSMRTAPAGVSTGSQPLALARIARQPAALHQHRIVRRDQQRRDDEEAGPAVHLPVVEVDAVRRPSQRPSSTTRRCCCSAAPRRRCAPAASHPAPAARRAPAAPRAAPSSAPRGPAATGPGARCPARRPGGQQHDDERSSRPIAARPCRAQGAARRR